jgi:hypothetical protein
MKKEFANFITYGFWCSLYPMKIYCTVVWYIVTNDNEANKMKGSRKIMLVFKNALYGHNLLNQL